MDARGQRAGREGHRRPVEATVPMVVLAQLPAHLAHSAEAAASPVTGAMDQGLPGFFYRAQRLLPPEGRLLGACHQQHWEDGELVDPCGGLIACARSAGLVYASTS